MSPVDVPAGVIPGSTLFKDDTGPPTFESEYKKLSSGYIKTVYYVPGKKGVALNVNSSIVYCQVYCDLASSIKQPGQNVLHRTCHGHTSAFEIREVEHIIATEKLFSSRSARSGIAHSEDGSRIQRHEFRNCDLRSASRITCD